MDHTKLNLFQKATATEEQIAQAILWAQASRGIAIPVPPRLESIPEEPVIERQPFYTIKTSRGDSGLLFKNPQDAQDVLELVDAFTGVNYTAGYSHEDSMCVASDPQPQISLVNLPTYDDLTAHGKRLKLYRETKEKNSRLLDEYRKEVEKSEELVEDVRDDFRQARQRYYKALNIMDQARSFLKMAQGNLDIALRFLAGQGHTPTEIMEMIELSAWMEQPTVLPDEYQTLTYEAIEAAQVTA